MVVAIKIKKHVKIVILIISLLIIAVVFPFILKATNTTDALGLSVNSVKYEFFWQPSDNTSVFRVYSNITIKNTSIRRITITFGSGCLWDTQIECSFVNKSLNYWFDEGTCSFWLVPIDFRPGITRMVDFVELSISNFTQPILPDGNYTLEVGVEYSEIYDEIKNSGEISFEVKDGGIIIPIKSVLKNADDKGIEVILTPVILTKKEYKLSKK